MFLISSNFKFFFFFFIIRDVYELFVTGIILCYQFLNWLKKYRFLHVFHYYEES